MRYLAGGVLFWNGDDAIMLSTSAASVYISSSVFFSIPPRHL